MNLKVFCCVMLISMSIGFTKAAICSNKGFFEANGTYRTNLQLIFSTLASNVTAHGGYYNTTLGQEPNKIYAMGLCRGGYDTEACFSCINAVTQELRDQCPNQTEAYVWGGDILCFVRYSRTSFFGSYSLDPMSALHSPYDMKVPNMTLFDDIWSDFMSRALTIASNGSDKLKYAATTEGLSDFQSIYAMMICTPDLSSTDCNSCLRECLSKYRNCCHAKQGGDVRRASCYFRWDLYPFNEAFNILLLSSPPPHCDEQKSAAKGKGSLSSRTIVTIVVPTVMISMVMISMALAAVVYIIFWRKKSYEDVHSSSSLVRSSDKNKGKTGDFSINEVSITELDPR